VNPLEILYCWQSVVGALVVYVLTQLVKSAIAAWFGAWFDATAHRRLVLKRYLLPAVPPLVGFVYAVSIPLRPDVLVAYVATHEIVGHAASLCFGAWGICVGQLADYAYSKITDAIRQKRVEMPDA
jgi:hypothetical protein